uniref:Uncharacterized protein n=1 Tax=Cacopsylla melanoneura TaxID=428564 RepID=A0A8D8XZ30_9HEMI
MLYKFNVDKENNIMFSLWSLDSFCKTRKKFTSFNLFGIVFYVSLTWRMSLWVSFRLTKEMHVYSPSFGIKKKKKTNLISWLSEQLTIKVVEYTVLLFFFVISIPYADKC